ncbi:MAG TPA: hypothetical protein VMI31_16855 [Fimbriimonadaceae bacterium]|nr:hypothetical protein [Fimbriimonadaceae bacterium]
MKHLWILAGGLALSALVVGAQSAYRIVINGKSVEGSAIVVKGQTYVPLKALQGAGVKASASGDTLSLTLSPMGGANQNNGVEGGLNEWLFNGVWRFRVTSAAKSADGSSFVVGVELRNGTQTDQLALSGTGFDSLKLVLSDGTMLDPYNITDLRDKGLPQGGAVTVDLQFPMDSIGDKKPDRLLLILKPDDDLKKYMRDNLKASYSVPDPSFRVKL